MKLLTAFLLLIPCLIRAQSLDEIVLEIETKNVVDYVFNKDTGSSPFASQSYINLDKNANNDDLVTLTSHKNGAVKAIAFLALTHRKYNNIYNIILQQLKDTTRVSTRIGCVVSCQYATDYFIMLSSRENFINYDLSKLSDSEILSLDSILISDKKSKLFARRRAIANIKSTLENYELIKSIVVKEKNADALSNLAEYKNQNDKKLIATFFKNEDTKSEALRSSIVFHDQYFYPLIKKAFKEEWKKSTVSEYNWERCYEALANYPSKETVSLFEKIKLLKDKESYRYRIQGKTLLVAINKYPNPTYEFLKNEIQLDDEDLKDVKYQIENFK